MENDENYEGKGKPSVSRSNYRVEMERAAKDRGFIQDNKDVTHDFAIIDKEVFNMSADDLPSNTDKPIYRRDERGIFRLYPDGRKKYTREKRYKILGYAHRNPPLEAVRRTVQKAIAEAHEAGFATAHCDKSGRVYLRYPDGRKEYQESCMDRQEGAEEKQRPSSEKQAWGELMYEYLRCECCDYIPDEFDMAQTDYYYLEVCHHCGRKVCPYCLVGTSSTAEELFQQLDDKDEDNRRWRFRCLICRGEHKDDIRGFHDAFPIRRALKKEQERKND